QDANIPVVANVTAREATNAEEIKSLLVEQVSSPVLWEDSVRYMIEQGVDTFVEIGEGNVLSGLVRKVNRKVRTLTVQNQETLQTTIETLQQVSETRED